jgi:hypothetical protein
MIQRLENWPLYQVFSSIFKKAQKNVKYMYVWIELSVCHYYEDNMTHTYPFGIAFWTTLFLEYSTKSFRKNL